MGEQVKQPEIRYGYTNALSMEQTDAEGTRYPWRIAIAADVDAALASARAEVEALRKERDDLREHIYAELRVFSEAIVTYVSRETTRWSADAVTPRLREERDRMIAWMIPTQAAREPGRSGA